MCSQWWEWWWWMLGITKNLLLIGSSFSCCPCKQAGNSFGICYRRSELVCGAVPADLLLPSPKRDLPPPLQNHHHHCCCHPPHCCVILLIVVVIIMIMTWCQILCTMRLQCVSKILTPRRMLQKTWLTSGPIAFIYGNNTFQKGASLRYCFVF